MTTASLIGEQGSIARMLNGLPGALDPTEQSAVAHIEKLRDALHIHMTPAELAKDKVELAKWGKVLHDEITKNARAAAAAAAAAKQQFDRTLSLDMSHVMRDLQERFAAQKRTFDTESARHVKDMATAFARSMLDFDEETRKGLAGLVVKQTPEEKALAEFVAKRTADDLAKSRADQLANAATPDERAALALGFSLDDQQQALQDAADASRLAQDDKTAADQQAYQDQRDALKQSLQDKETDLEQGYQDQRDLQWQALQDLNDDQATKLQDNLNDWTAWIDAKKKTYADFLSWASGQGIDTGGLLDPSANGGSVPLAPIAGTGAALAVLGKRQTHQLPKFDKGGIVPGMRGAPTLAIVHGGERITPAGVGGGGDLNATFVLQTPDGDVMWRVVQRYALRDLLRNGTTGFDDGRL
jgi:hypothetical protein